MIQNIYLQFITLIRLGTIGKQPGRSQMVCDIARSKYLIRGQDTNPAAARALVLPRVRVPSQSREGTGILIFITSS
jgi:hypothetical protein